MGFESPYAFDAKVLREIEVARVPFTSTYRQTDPLFVEYLACIQRGELIDLAIQAINSACCRPHRTDRIPVILAPTNARVSRARSITGLSLARPLRSSDVRIDPRIAGFTAEFEGNDPVLRWPAAPE
jgi:ATP-dependent DNA helicase PIF1